MAVAGGGTDPVRWWIVPGPLPVPISCVPGREWSGWEARYENDAERHKRTARVLPEPLAQHLEPFFSGIRREAWEEYFGIPGLISDPTLHGGGLHVTSPGGHLSVHLDYDLHPFMPGMRRAVNLIAFLNPEWRVEWGGALVLCNPMGEPMVRIHPAPGRMVAFETNDLSYHGVEPVTGPVERVTAAMYFLAPAGPQNTRRRALFIPNRGS